jgi:ureidoglycolate hydrolase
MDLNALGLHSVENTKQDKSSYLNLNKAKADQHPALIHRPPSVNRSSAT